jgi:ssDNA-binding Zn-finger/Zn-ribbon topoisomerase 1
VLASNIKCPVCGSSTRLRISKKDGSKFHVCVNYPDCKGKVAFDEDWDDEWEKQPKRRKSTPQKSKKPIIAIVAVVASIIIIAGIVIPVVILSDNKSNTSPHGTSSIYTPTTAPTSTPTEGSTTLSVEEAGALYLEHVAPVNSAQDAFFAKAANWTDYTTNPQALSDAQPYINALAEWKVFLQSTHWPTVAQADVRNLTEDVGNEIAVLVSLSTVNYLNVGQWLQDFISVTNTGNADAAWVRMDLGLPPPQ